MNSGNKAFIAAFVLFIGVILIIAAAAVYTLMEKQEDLDINTLTFADYAEAEEARATDFLPKFLPENAEDMRETARISTGQIWGQFSFDSEEPFPGPGDPLELVPAEEVVFPSMEASSAVAQWPAELTDNAPAPPPYLFYRTVSDTQDPYDHDDGKPLFVAVDEESDRAWYWNVVENAD
jgi:hypothetical protein